MESSTMPSEVEAPPELVDLTTTAAVEQPSDTEPPDDADSNGKSPATDAGRKTAKTASDHSRWLEKVGLLRPCIKEDGSMDYSSLDEESQKRMQSFVKDQRKSYRKRERNAAGPMTDERFRILSEAGFDFNPTETKSKRSREKGGKKKSKGATKDHEDEKPAAMSHKSSSGEDASDAKRSKSMESMQTNGSAEKSTSARDASPSMEAEDLTSDYKMPAKKSPGSASMTSLKSEDADSIMSGGSSPKLASKTPVKEGFDGTIPSKKTPKSASRASSPTPASARKKSGKPTYLDMAHDAIVSLKDRTGSSIPAISKWIYANHEHVTAASPNLFKKRLGNAIKEGVKEGRFVKVKNSFKINAEWTKKQKAKAKAKEAAKKKAEKLRQKELEKIKQKKAKDKAKLLKEKDLEMEKHKAAEEKKRKEREMTPEEREAVALKKKRKEEAEARRKFIEQQLRKRRYPIEDTRLHREDKEWGVKPPEHVSKRPTLPRALTCLIPPHLRADTASKSFGSVADASAFGSAKLLGGDRGLISDAIHVFHFFCGDVGVDGTDHPIPKFSLKTLLYAADEVISGNAKTAKSLPPLFTHLFVTALRMLTAPPDVDEEEPNMTEIGPVELRLQDDLTKLREGLNVVSWSQICYFYMDLMDRYYSSDVSLEEGVLPGEGKLDMSHLWNEDHIEEENIGTELKDDEVGSTDKRHSAYLGDPTGSLVKGYSKLQNQTEPWALKADELMALLRMLTDDILAKRPDLAEDIASRGAKLHELFKVKRAAVMKYNKVKLAFEGKPPRNQKKSSETKPDDKKEDQDDSEQKPETEKPFVPTATKQQFTAAEKAYNRAVEAYENGLNKLMMRTEPAAFDRHHNAIYFFRHDPTMLHIEQIKPSSLPTEIKRLGPELTPFSSWHSIDTKPLFEQFLESLDDRGQREDEALKVCASLTVLKRRLQDDKKENTRVAAREREKEELKRRLENARNACNANDGKRSGRLAGMAIKELESLEESILEMTKAHDEEERQEKMGREKLADYSLLTGLQMVTDLFAGQRGTRSSKKTIDEDQGVAASLANAPSHKLWMDKSTGGNGTLQILVGALLELEDKCDDLSPWAREDTARKAWRKQLSDASFAWAVDCVLQLGPSTEGDGSNSDDGTLPSVTKKQKVDPASGTSLASIVAALKLCLKDLELRVFEISGKKISIEEADTAVGEDESSNDESADEVTKRRSCWKVKINALKRIPSTRYGLIRDIIIAAITVARKAHLNQVAADLKSALQLLRPSAASEARSAAIEVLEKHGGHDESDEDVDFDELAAANANEPNVDDQANGTEIASLLCAEVQMMSGSVGGDDFADQSDWCDSIKDCKSVSRLAVLVHIFIMKADGILSQLHEERGNLDSVLGLNARRNSRSKTSIRKHDSSTSIWCNAETTSKLVKARVQGYPWWPAHVCKPLEKVVAEALEGSGYTIIRSVGNPNMFLVGDEEILDFTEETEEDLSKYSESLIGDLHESVSIAKKLWRKRNIGVASPWSKKSRPRFSEEKKTDAH